MYSVTQRAREYKQPRGGYLPNKAFTCIQLDDGEELSPENLPGGTVGTVVDYLTRFLIEGNREEAFQISLLGAKRLGEETYAMRLLDDVTGINEKSIIAACKLVPYDAFFRAGYTPKSAAPIPDDDTIHNIQLMVKRSISFFEEYGTPTQYGFTFEGGGYTPTVSSGDGDFITGDTMWDFKVTKDTSIKSHYTLQLLMYYIMGVHSGQPGYRNITKLGFFNPRLNRVYTISVSDISSDTIKEVEDEVIRYNKPSPSIMDTNVPKVKSEESAKDYLDVNDLSTMFGFSKKSIYAFIKAGYLPAQKKGNRYIFYNEDILALVQRLKAEKRKRVVKSILYIGFALIFILLFYAFFPQILSFLDGI